MPQNFEQDIPLPIIILLFLTLIFLSTFLRKGLRARKLIREGQIPSKDNHIPTIEERIKGNSAWASGEIRSKGGLMYAFWLLSVVWMLTFGISFIKSFTNPTIPVGGKIMLGIFSLLGIVPIFFAIRTTRQQLRFGHSTCSIIGKAGVLGKEMSGYIRTKGEIMPSGDYVIQLRCIETYSVGSGKNRTTKTDILWQEKRIIPYRGQSSRAGIPFKFDIPTYPPETGYQISRGDVDWQILIDAPTDGVKYSALFVVPVFKLE